MIGQRAALIERGRTFMADLDPTMGHEQAGMRPVIAVSAPEISAAGILTVIPTTTQKLERVYPYEVLIEAGDGLPLRSKALANQIRTLDIKERLGEPIGRVDPSTLEEIDRAIALVLFGPEALF